MPKNKRESKKNQNLNRNEKLKHSLPMSMCISLVAREKKNSERERDSKC